jgi:hypothetical protein
METIGRLSQAFSLRGEDGDVIPTLRVPLQEVGALSQLIDFRSQVHVLRLQPTRLEKPGVRTTPGTPGEDARNSVAIEVSEQRRVRYDQPLRWRHTPDGALLRWGFAAGKLGLGPRVGVGNGR